MISRPLFHHDLNPQNPLVVGALADPSLLTLPPALCDVVELRLDSLGTSPEVIHFAKNSPLPLLITARGRAEGGECDWSIPDRLNAYTTFLPYASAIDIELHDFPHFSTLLETARSLKVSIVGSFHDFEKTPPLDHLVTLFHPQADLHKFALATHTIDDLKIHLDLLQHPAPTPLSVMGMGPLGAAARPLMARTGSVLNYGYLGQKATAPNQWPVDLLKATLSH